MAPAAPAGAPARRPISSTCPGVTGTSTTRLEPRPPALPVPRPLAPFPPFCPLRTARTVETPVAGTVYCDTVETFGEVKHAVLKTGAADAVGAATTLSPAPATSTAAATRERRKDWRMCCYSRLLPGAGARGRLRVGR
ncbi:hypothetical protein C5C50_15755 [Rathayibacter sp. AY1D9]|nr:hypothetical protein C5C50_15755 [Rathayibacter sp. AY1D9]